MTNQHYTTMYIALMVLRDKYMVETGKDSITKDDLNSMLVDVILNGDVDALEEATKTMREMGIKIGINA